jgi:hypothetical protein
VDEDPDEGYLMSACTIHCLQLQLVRPMEKYIGPGGLTKRNAVQMCHKQCLPPPELHEDPTVEDFDGRSSGVP